MSEYGLAQQEMAEKWVKRFSPVLIRQLKNYIGKIIGQYESLWDAVQQAFCHVSYLSLALL